MFSAASSCAAVASCGAGRVELWQGECPAQVPVTAGGEKDDKAQQAGWRRKAALRGSLQCWAVGCLPSCHSLSPCLPAGGSPSGTRASPTGAGHPRGWAGHNRDAQRPPGGFQRAKSLCTVGMCKMKFWSLFEDLWAKRQLLLQS